MKILFVFNIYYFKNLGYNNISWIWWSYEVWRCSVSAYFIDHAYFRYHRIGNWYERYSNCWQTFGWHTGTASSIYMENCIFQNYIFQILRDLIIKEKKKQHLEWLQKLLLECCYVKLILKSNPLREDHQNLPVIMEPVAYHSICK